jgi:hypothetical protein
VSADEPTAAADHDPLVLHERLLRFRWEGQRDVPTLNHNVRPDKVGKRGGGATGASIGVL